MYRLVGIHNKKAIRLITVGCILLLFTVLVPFCPDVLPITAGIHNFTAFTGTVLMVATVYYFVYALSKLDKRIYKKGMIALNVVVGISVILYFLKGITSAVEIILVVGNLGVLFFMFLSLQRSDRIDTLKELEKLEEEKEQKKTSRASGMEETRISKEEPPEEEGSPKESVGKEP